MKACPRTDEHVCKLGAHLVPPPRVTPAPSFGDALLTIAAAIGLALVLLGVWALVPWMVRP